MTRPRRDGNEAPFKDWVRHHPKLGSKPDEAALSVCDVDNVFHKYIVVDKSSGLYLHRHHLMCVELKTHMAKAPFAQRDTLDVLDQALDLSHKQKIKTARGVKMLYYHGLHLLQLSDVCPVTSDQMLWDGKIIDEPTLVGLLLFDVDAKTLKVREDRSHHKQEPMLIGDALYPPEK